MVQRYNWEETAHIKILSEQQLKMKTDQEKLFYSSLLQMHSITIRGQFNQDTKQNYIRLLLPLSFNIQAKVL